MATKVPIPKLGQSEETVTIENWHVKEGDVIKKGDVLFDVETDKAVLEVESQFEGTLLKIIIPAGKEVPVMSTAAVIGEKGEAIPEIEE
ncbi:MAG: biotin/lipoyl-binding protein, partial [Victivallales bacterium]|nr:biotin/lipoyl-binding protein [Victivallales bacterium]